MGKLEWVTDMKEGMKLICALALLTRLGLSAALPLAGAVLAAVWLRARFDLGVWVLLAGVLVGVISGVNGFIRLLRAAEILFKNEKDDGEGDGHGSSHIHPF